MPVLITNAMILEVYDIIAKEDGITTNARDYVQDLLIEAKKSAHMRDALFDRMSKVVRQVYNRAKGENGIS